MCVCVCGYGKVVYLTSLTLEGMILEANASTFSLAMLQSIHLFYYDNHEEQRRRKVGRKNVFGKREKQRGDRADQMRWSQR